ncbi:RagB/SusD family nutrient uptake outer membrane protein [Robiginitalea sp. IMCC44478]|uniref:RagB/SusD family nutrient uptake outer membrane protein n=1 Tax=Robiginitalea sp. IMCC44478 TaxID=3459122 RepID=UPI00404299ED
MKNKHIILSLLFLLFLGCDNNLDTQPTDSLTPEQLLENPENLDKTLLGAYATSLMYAGNYQTATELLVNEGQLAYRGTFPDFFEFDRKQVTTSGNFYINFTWFNSYSSINLCNLVLDNLELQEDDEIRSRLEGEAKFLRALHYFELVRFYALPFETGESNGQLGVPLVFEAVTNLSQVTYPSRSSVGEVYAQILSDLQDAYTLLPPDNAERADRFAARALQARVYLQQGNYAAARDAAHDVLVNSGHSLAPTLAAAFNNEADGIEDIFAWQVTTQDGFNDFNNYWATLQFGGRSQTADVTIEPPFFNLFTGPDDRSDFFYSGNGTTVTGKWQGQFANVPYMRIAEMHLIRAESNFREGSSLGLTPEQEINALRGRSNAGPLSGIGLQDILEERQRELAFEGFRLHDAKRLQQTIDGLPYNAAVLVMPLPQREIDVNPNLVQNPGYEN